MASVAAAWTSTKAFTKARLRSRWGPEKRSPSARQVWCRKATPLTPPVITIESTPPRSTSPFVIRTSGQHPKRRLSASSSTPKPKKPRENPTPSKTPKYRRIVDRLTSYCKNRKPRRHRKNQRPQNTPYATPAGKPLSPKSFAQHVPSVFEFGPRQSQNGEVYRFHGTRTPAMGTKALGSHGMDNLYMPTPEAKAAVRRTGLRPIIIDGSNVAFGHGDSKFFSARGIDICVRFFQRRGHQEVNVIVPAIRFKTGMCQYRHLLDKLDREGIVIKTPFNAYDDRYIIQIATLTSGVIVSNDLYRDLRHEDHRMTSTIRNRVLQFTWFGDVIMFPQDPHGRNGPTLNEFLKFNGNDEV